MALTSKTRSSAEPTLACGCGWTGPPSAVLTTINEPDTWICPACLTELVKQGAPATPSQQNDTQH